MIGNTGLKEHLPHCHQIPINIYSDAVNCFKQIRSFQKNLRYQRLFSAATRAAGLLQDYVGQTFCHVLPHSRSLHQSEERDCVLDRTFYFYLNITAADGPDVVTTQPFWNNMNKLFVRRVCFNFSNITSTFWKDLTGLKVLQTKPQFQRINLGAETKAATQKTTARIYGGEAAEA